ncbi:hypothetical protein PV08_00723 [Exophiala spinifera]|uniref:Fungal N-terminal domain-containing protein n=1 Tax=Exophiala spinifera TaxID=91928 RepID=A0A0D2BMI7_9EURO|nr:uncharacterized protein PV08_00723 [Exophiala spinifera]KIW20148.1 hypothetical protein PV08_00723 [Exophiala spinifera]
MAQKMRFTSSTPASLAEVCKLAWHTFYGMQKVSEDFENLRFEVWTIAISLDSLHSVGTTSTLIDRQPDRARWALTFTKILTSLGSALRPLHNLVRLYLSSSTKERAIVKNWLTHPECTYEGATIQDFRRKLSMLVESLNVFLSCLTHAELARAKDVSETEEWRVLSEVTKNVLHKWDSDVATGIRRPTDRIARPIEPPGYVSEDVRSYITPLLNNGSPGLGVQTIPEPPPSPMPPTRPRFDPNTQHHQPSGVSNLDDIEHGFRSHMHAMRRIREQLRQQKMNNHGLTDQSSRHFPETHSNHEHRLGGLPPPTPTTPTLQRKPTDSSQADNSVDYADASSCGGSSSLQTSETGSVISSYRGNADEDVKPVIVGVVVPHQQRSPERHERKRRRQAQYRFKTGLEDSQSGGSSDDSASDEVPGVQSRPKSALEQLLTTALFFDQ